MRRLSYTGNQEELKNFIENNRQMLEAEIREKREALKTELPFAGGSEGGTSTALFQGLKQLTQKIVVRLVCKGAFD